MKKIRRIVLISLLLSAAPGLAQVVNKTWVGDGSGNFSNGNWSDPALWSPPGVPNNSGPTVYDVTITNDPAGAQFNGPQVDIDVMIENLNLVNRVFLDNQGSFGSTLTVTNDTNLSTQPGHEGDISAIFCSGGTFLLGNLSVYDDATHTLNDIFLFPFNGATIGFRNADIEINKATLIIGDAASQIIDQDSNESAIRNLRVNESSLTLSSGINFTTAGDFTNNNNLQLETFDGMPTVFTVSGELTNFDSTTQTFSNARWVLQVGEAGGDVTLRFPDADILTLAFIRLSLIGAGASIRDLGGQDALRNLQSIEFTTLALGGDLTVTPDGGTLMVSDSSSISLGPEGTNNDSSLTVNGAMVVEDSTFDFRGTPGVDAPYHNRLEVMNGIEIRAARPAGAITTGIEFRNAHLIGNGTIVGDVAFLQGSVLSPGNSPGELSFEGNVTFDDTAQVEIELQGLEPGTGFDVIHQTSNSHTIDLGSSTLKVSFLSGFESEVTFDDSFTIMDSALEITGEFGNVSPGDRLGTANVPGSFYVSYGPDAAATNEVILSEFVPIRITAIRHEPGRIIIEGTGAPLTFHGIQAAATLTETPSFIDSVFVEGDGTFVFEDIVDDPLPAGAKKFYSVYFE